MKKETSQCQNCKKSFVIDASDFAFYDRIKVPAPTFCPGCRLQRRLATQNLFNLYKRKCDLCKQEKISMYAPDAPYTIYCAKCWWGDGWDRHEYAQDYDFSRPFFEQFNELWHKVPLLGLSIDIATAENSPYNNHCGPIKNCYLTFYNDLSEDCSYGFYIINCKGSLDCSLVGLIDKCYDSRNLFKSNKCIGSENTIESINSTFLNSCTNCQNCFASSSLRNKNYYIFNKPYTKEEYFKKLEDWDLGSYKVYNQIKQRAKEHWRKFPPKPIYQDFSINVRGNYVFQSKNCYECYEVTGAEDSKYLFMMTEGPTKDVYDISGWGDNMDLSYECAIVGENVTNIKFSQESGLTLANVEYSKLSTGGSNHFGCVSMKKGDYAILNKQYSKDEYFKLRERIIKHMDEMPYKDKVGRIYKYGEFFPIEINPFSYNETLAQSFFPLSKESIDNNGYKYREIVKTRVAPTKKSSELPDHIKDAQKDILNEIIGCETCERSYKFTEFELNFLKNMNLPLPRRCPFCRIQDRFQEWVKQMNLIKRTCLKCNTEFYTPYTEEEYKEILCSKCYNLEVV